MRTTQSLTRLVSVCRTPAGCAYQTASLPQNQDHRIETPSTSNTSSSWNKKRFKALLIDAAGTLIAPREDTPTVRIERWWRLRAEGCHATCDFTLSQMHGLTQSRSILQVYLRYARQHGVTLSEEEVLARFRHAYNMPWSVSSLPLVLLHWPLVVLQ
jgi:hypothetical protein